MISRIWIKYITDKGKKVQYSKLDQNAPWIAARCSMKPVFEKPELVCKNHCSMVLMTTRYDQKEISRNVFNEDDRAECFQGFIAIDIASATENINTCGIMWLSMTKYYCQLDSNTVSYLTVSSMRQYGTALQVIIL